MNKAVGEFLFCGGFGRWEALGLYGGDLWQIIYGCSSDYHDIVSSNLLSINFFSFHFAADIIFGYSLRGYA